MDDKWRTMACPICRGYGMTWNPEAWDGAEECDNCNYGTVWLRPKGHSFQYPGGPANGVWGPEEYKKAKPEMPWDWHSWDHTEGEIDKFILDRNGSFDGTLNTVNCTCKKFTGTIKEHEVHAEEMKQQFIVEHSG